MMKRQDRTEDEEEVKEGDDENDPQNDSSFQIIKSSLYSTAPDDISSSRALWAYYKASTEIFSTRLCEQLRLILEPTLATRLQGAYALKTKLECVLYKSCFVMI
jgi:midasin